MENRMGYRYRTEEISCRIDGQRIYGVAYVPEREGRLPLVIFAHQLGYTHAAGSDYAAALASRGIGVYTFDFRGGGVDSRSDGQVVEMSIMTEADDLEAVIDTARGWDFVDGEKIVLLGASQGGAVSAVVAARSGEKVAGLILLYPAFMIYDEIHALFDPLEEMPERSRFLGWIDVGRRYAADIWDYDAYGEMKKYKKPVLIIQGGKDLVVDASYAQKAQKCYPDARLCMIGRAGHGFYGRSFRESVGYIMEHLERLGIESAEP